MCSDGEGEIYSSEPSAFWQNLQQRQQWKSSQRHRLKISCDLFKSKDQHRFFYYSWFNIPPSSRPGNVFTALSSFYLASHILLPLTYEIGWTIWSLTFKGTDLKLSLALSLYCDLKFKSTHTRLLGDGYGMLYLVYKVLIVWMSNALNQAWQMLARVELKPKTWNSGIGSAELAQYLTHRSCAKKVWQEPMKEWASGWTNEWMNKWIHRGQLAK